MCHRLAWHVPIHCQLVVRYISSNPMLSDGLSVWQLDWTFGDVRVNFWRGCFALALDWRSSGWIYAECKWGWADNAWPRIVLALDWQSIAWRVGERWTQENHDFPRLVGPDSTSSLRSLRNVRRDWPWIGIDWRMNEMPGANWYDSGPF